MRLNDYHYIAKRTYMSQYSLEVTTTYLGDESLFRRGAWNQSDFNLIGAADWVTWSWQCHPISNDTFNLDAASHERTDFHNLSTKEEDYPFTAGAAYIRVSIFYYHIKYHLLNMLKINSDINQQYLKTVDLNFAKSE